jgi:hypothetical protein
MKQTRYINRYSVELDIQEDKYLRFDIVRPSKTDNWEGECHVSLINIESKEPELISEGLSLKQIKKLTESLGLIIKMEEVK